MGEQTSKKEGDGRQKAEEALALSEKLLRSLAENAPVGVYLTDINGDYRYANQKWCEMAGMSLEDALGDGWVNALHPDDRERVGKQWYQLSATEWGWKQEYRFQTPGGKVTWITGYATKARDERGVLVGFFGINVDSSSSKNMETALLASEERYRATIDSMSDGIFVIDHDLKITLNNSTIARWVQEMGQSGILVGKTPAKAFSFLSKNAESEYREIFQSGEILQTEELSSFVHRAVYTETRKIPFVENGEVSQVATVIRDITERKQAEKALQESEEKFRLLFESMAQGVFYQQTDGQLVDANFSALEMLGITRDQFLGRTSYDPAWKVILEDGTALPSEQHPSMLALQTGKSIEDFMLGVYRPNTQDHCWMIVNAIPQFRPGEEKPYQVFVTLHDITERKQAEIALENSEKLYRNVLISISDAVYITDERGEFTFICPNVDVIFGYTPEDVQKIGNINKLLGTQITDYEEVSKAGEINNLEHEIVDKSGHKHALLINVKKVDIENGKMLYTCHDITERKRAEDEIRRQAERLKTLRDTTLEVANPHKLSLLLPTIVERAADLVGASEGGLYLSDPDKQEVHCVVSYNTKRDFTGIVLKFGEGAAGTVAQTGEALIIDNYRTWPKRASVFEEDQPFLSILSVPLLWLGQVSGVLHVLNDVEGKSFSQADQELLTMFAAQAAIAVGKAEMLEQAQQEIEERKRVEKRLRDSEFKLKNAEKVAHFGHYEIDIQTGKTKWSDETFRIFELDPNTDTVPTAQEYANYLHPDDIDMLYAHFDETINNKKDFDLDYRIITQNKKIRYVHSLGKLTSDVNGNPITMFGVFHDITERKQTEDILATRLRISEMAAYQSQDKLLQITLDEVERLTGSSIGFFHFVEDDQINLHLQMWSTNTLETMCTIEGQGQHYPVDKAGVWVECLHKKQPVIHNDYESLPNKKGYPEGHSKVVRELTVPIIIGNKVKAIIGVGNKETDYVESDVSAVSTLANMVWDIIVRKQAELALIDSEKNFQAILDASFDSMLLIEKDGQIVTCNQTVATRFGKDKFDVIGTSVYDLVDEVVAERRRGFVEQVIASGEAVRFEDERLGRTIDNSIYPIFDNDGQVVRLALYGQDVTESKVAERALQENEHNLQLIFDTMSECITLNEIIYDENGEMVDYRILKVNPAFYATADYSGKEVEGNLATRLYGMSTEFIKEFWKEHLKKNTTAHTEMLSPLNNKSFYVSTSPFANDRFVTSFIDITERKETEEAIQKSQLRFQQVLENAFDAAYSRNLLTDTYEYMSPAIEKISGYTAKEYSEIPIAKIFDYIHPDDVQQIVDYIEKSMTADENPYYVEYRFRHKDGDYRWFGDLFSVVKSETGIPLARFGSVRDITEHKQVEVKLLESEERYRRLAENAPDIIFRYTLSPSPKLEYINPATEKITGYTPEDCYANPLLMLNMAHPEDAHLMADLMQSHGQFNKQITMRWIGKDSIVRWMESRLVPVYDEANQLVAVEGLTRDITERKLAEQENERLLAEITQQREELRALNARLVTKDETERRRIARELHDQIGQNLSALSINMNILLSQASADDEKLRKRIHTSLQLVDETADSIRNVMENLHPTVLDDYGLMPALEWLSERISERTDLQVRVSSRNLKQERLQPQVEMSLFRITQESISNVLRHAQATKVKIELKQLKKVLRLSIADDGAGFDLSGHPEPGKGKQGWGLRIMRERAESIGGSFRVESEAGKGAIVVVELSNDNNYFVS